MYWVPLAAVSWTVPLLHTSLGGWVVVGVVVAGAAVVVAAINSFKIEINYTLFCDVHYVFVIFDDKKLWLKYKNLSSNGILNIFIWADNLS